MKNQKLIISIKPSDPFPITNNIKNSNLSTAISSITYGLSCLVYQLQSNSVYQCFMMIHQQYINILHIIVNRSISYLLKLNDVKSIVTEDTFIASKLSNLTIITPEIKQNYIVINMTTYKTIVFAFNTQNQRNIVFMGLKFFINEGKYYYNMLSQYDPFKAQSMMLFLQADKDGGNLLDIQEIISILGELKINKQKIDIQADVLQINKQLYERQNLKQPKNASSLELIPIAFEYLLRYYSIKEELAKYFKEYCPMFKIKSKNHKNTIVDIIKNNQKPIMSSSQLKLFYSEILFQNDKQQSDFDQIIKKFPVYDGQGKQKFEINDEEILLSFDNFCNLIFSKQNSLLLQKKQQKEQQNQDRLIHMSQMRNKPKTYVDYSLLDYHIYSDLCSKNQKRKDNQNYYTMALKRGVKCINIQVSVSMNHSLKSGSSQQNSTDKKSKTSNLKLGQLVVRIDQKQRSQVLLDNILKQVKVYAFQNNNLPFFIVFDINLLFSVPNYTQYLELLNQIIEDQLQLQCIFILGGTKYQKKNILPSPKELQKKFVIFSNFNPKAIPRNINNKNQLYQIPQSLSKKITFHAAKLDFQRKGQTCWNSCFIPQEKLKNYQSVEQQNISNYSRKLMIMSVQREQPSGRDEIYANFRQGVQFIGNSFGRNRQSDYLIHSKFSQIQSQYFGYLLKPEYMFSENNAPLYSNKNFTKQLPTRLKFHILSGQKLILNQTDYHQFYVQVSSRGNISDEQLNKSYKSEKKTEGFYTEINLQCQFVVYNQQLFTILIVIKNCQNGKIIAGRSVSLKNIRQGLRTISLFDEKMQTKQNSYLLVHFTKKEVFPKQQKFNKMQQFLK